MQLLFYETKKPGGVDDIVAGVAPALVANFCAAIFGRGRDTTRVG